MTKGRVLTIVGALFVAVIAGSMWYMLAVPGKSFQGKPPPLTADQQQLKARLEAHVAAIASEPHNTAHPAALERAAAYIEATLTGMGYRPRAQVFSVANQSVRNIEVISEPFSVERGGVSAGTLVVGAHYDSFGDAPGANDNGTGSAAVIELARYFKTARLAHLKVRFVLFVNEEPPYFQTSDMGSLRYAKMIAASGERLVGMLSLETLGSFSFEPGSQRYPLNINLFFPDAANFIAFVAMPGSRDFLHNVIGAFRLHAKVASIGGVATDLIPGIGWSDHWSFAQYGIPAVMVTDTALFRYEAYHTTRDKADQVDFSMVARITEALQRVLTDLDNRYGKS